MNLADSLPKVFHGAFPSTHLGQASQEVALKLLQPVDPGPDADQSDAVAYQAAKSGWSREPFQSACKSYCTARHEVNILQTLNHPNIVSFIGLCCRPLAIVLELAPLGSLADVFKNYKRARMRIDQFTIQRSLLQVAKALEFLHQHRIIYRDLKTENILVWSFPSPFATQSQIAQVQLKLADYGISRQALSTGIWKGFAGTMSFLAPEILRHNGDEEYTEKVDCFSFGMFMYELLTLRPPSNKQGEIAAAGGARSYSSEGGGRPTLMRRDLIYPNYMVDLMSLCWSQEPQDRPTASQIVSIASSPEFMQIHDAVVVPECDLTRPYRFASAVEYEQSLELWHSKADSQVSILSTKQDQWHYCEHIKLPLNSRSRSSRISAMCLVEDKIWLCDSLGTIYLANASSRVDQTKDYDADRTAITQDGEDDGRELHLMSFQPIVSQSKTMGEICTMIYARQASSVVFLTVEGLLWILKLEDMICSQLEDSSIKITCIMMPEEDEKGKQASPITKTATEEQSFQLYCGQLNGISCLEVCDREIRRQSILPLAGTNSTDLDGEPLVDLNVHQSAEIGNIVATRELLWTSAGCTVHLWNIKGKHVIRKLDCCKLVPCSESLESINIEQYYLEAQSSTVTSMVHMEDQLFVGTSHGCLIVIEASTLKPMTVFRPYESNVIIMVPFIPVPNRPRSGQTQQQQAKPKAQHLVALGYGYRDLMKRYLNFLEADTRQQAKTANTRDKELVATLMRPNCNIIYDS